MMILDLPNKTKEIQAELNNINEHESLYDSLTTLQNEVSVYHKTKVTAITSIKDEALAASFAKAYALVYSHNGSSALIIDANLYNPSLLKVLDKKEEEGDVEINNKSEFTYVDEKTNALCLEKEIYPSNVYKSGSIQKSIKENFSKYDHFIVLVPTLKAHKEISLLGDDISTVMSRL